MRSRQPGQATTLSAHERTRAKYISLPLTSVSPSGSIERSAPLTTLYDALLGHVEVPVRMIVAAAVLLAPIGGMALPR